jgi:hypothetical protein
MVLCGIIGRLLDDDDIAVVDDIVTAMSSADPRLWPFKITRLGAAYGHATFGMGTTFVASQGAIFGANRFQEIAGTPDNACQITSCLRYYDHELGDSSASTRTRDWPGSPIRSRDEAATSDHSCAYASES